MAERTGTDPRRRLNLIIAVNIFCWAIAIFIDADPIVADMAGLAFLTTLALYPWKTTDSASPADSRR